MELWRKGKLMLGEYLVHMGSSVEHSAPCIFIEPRDYISSKEHLRASGYCERVKQVNSSTFFR